jgi:hypothetical protein
MIGTIHEDRHNDGWQLPRRREEIKWKIETEAKNQFPGIMGAANNLLKSKHRRLTYNPY